ncbi:serine/threonine-protein kinase [Tautonia plasticadhaerens]|uniref:Serine/threonine-protein kinase Pkn1 n=1 Tax=Tautonia plasticadhaerens TaxID=2527974 RepID=A0A518HFF7_9BACT|nr:serine/threonine-protein kinase [Tautonia plasticadhaerens]QDV39561.1 Serine/threonine-protein kinase Pkn1 [Tautonia plasticadhaerens]
MHQTAPNAEEIFLAALEIEGAEARSSYLDEVCGDPELRRHVEHLLALDARASGFLEPPASTPTLTVEAPNPLEGTVIGPYRLMEQIGEGGMGVVYVAEQLEPVRRRVALKVIKPGMDTEQVVARFEAERQALALMDHPNIARVIDAGMTASGRPYFVMELVRGIQITEYCDGEQLSIRDRLELFVLVCRAVQHAHQKGVIHRDLKPSNILVTVIDGEAVPKVIDFGVAKATGPALTDRSLFTCFHQLIGTPLYMSPEQAALTGVDVDTRSDIYSLGVLLYELLTGTTPFDSESLRRAAFDEMRRIICEEEPPRPSTRLSSLGVTLSTASAKRKADPRRLVLSLRSELDWVVMKALEKDRRRRYETANDFAADVLRYLTDRPVEACPPSAWYRLGKFARRNRLAFGIGSSLAASLVLGVLGLTAGLLAIARERSKAEERLVLARQAVDEMYTEVAEEWLADREQMTPLQRQFLEKALRFYTRFAAEPAADPEDRHKAAQALERVGQIQRAFGQTLEALSSSERAVARLTALAGEIPDRPEYRRSLSEALGSLAQLQGEAGRIVEAESTHRRAIAIHGELRRAGADRIESEELSLLYWHHYLLSEVLIAKGWGNAAKREADRAFEVAGQRLKETPNDPGARHEMALALIENAKFSEAFGRPAEAEELLRRAVAIIESPVAEKPAKAEYRAVLALGWNNLGVLLMNLGRQDHEAERLDDARAAFQQGDAVSEQLVEAYPHVVRYRSFRAGTLNNLGYALMHAGRLDEALDVHRRCLAIREQILAQYPDVPEHRADVSFSLGSVASALGKGGNWAQVLELIDRAVSDLRSALAASVGNSRYGDRLQDTLRRRAEARLKLGDHEAAAEDAHEMWHGGIPNSNQGRTAFNAYLTLRDCLTVARNDPELALERREEVADAYLDRARAMLNEAERCGAMNATGTVIVQLVTELAASDLTEVRDPVRAVRVAEGYLERHPGEAELWKALGLARYRAGDGDGAIQAVEEAKEIKGRLTTPLEFTLLAAAHASKGEMEVARGYFERARAASTEHWMSDTPQSLTEEAASLLGMDEPTGAARDPGDESRSEEM